MEGGMLCVSSNNVTWVTKVLTQVSVIDYVHLPLISSYSLWGCDWKVIFQTLLFDHHLQIGVSRSHTDRRSRSSSWQGLSKKPWLLIVSGLHSSPLRYLHCDNCLLKTILLEAFGKWYSFQKKHTGSGKAVQQLLGMSGSRDSEELNWGEGRMQLQHLCSPHSHAFVRYVLALHKPQ